MSILTTALLDVDECADVAARVRAHEARWTRRSVSEFFTLGAASYLDDEPAYMSRAAATNPILDTDFGDLQERCARPRRRLDAPCPGVAVRAARLPHLARAGHSDDGRGVAALGSNGRVPFPSARGPADRPSRSRCRSSCHGRWRLTTWM